MEHKNIQLILFYIISYSLLRSPSFLLLPGLNCVGCIVHITFCTGSVFIWSSHLCYSQVVEINYIKVIFHLDSDADIWFVSICLALLVSFLVLRCSTLLIHSLTYSSLHNLGPIQDVTDPVGLVVNRFQFRNGQNKFNLGPTRLC